jgi:DNA-binding transcriptional MerR regulator
MPFTPQQARTITGVPIETLRHWRTVIPYLAQRSGKAARFSPVDLVGLAVLQQLTVNFGVSIAKMRVGIDLLFRTLANSDPLTLRGKVVAVGESQAQLCVAKSPMRVPRSALIIVPCAALIDQIQANILPMVRFDPASVQKVGDARQKSRIS